MLRLTIVGKHIDSLESTCSTIIKNARDHEFRAKGPVRIPTKKLSHTVRRSPCGEGSNTWDHFEMKIHKRVIDLFCPVDSLKDITTFKLDAGVTVNLQVNDI